MAESNLLGKTLLFFSLLVPSGAEAHVGEQ